jgi:hypothetical protein
VHLLAHTLDPLEQPRKAEAIVRVKSVHHRDRPPVSDVVENLAREVFFGLGKCSAQISNDVAGMNSFHLVSMALFGALLPLQMFAPMFSASSRSVPAAGNRSTNGATQISQGRSKGAGNVSFLLIECAQFAPTLHDCGGNAHHRIVV